MTVVDNSLDAYHSLERLGSKQMVVYQVLKNSVKPLNNRQLSELLGWGVNRVTPRVLELRELGLVVEVVVAIDPVTRRKSSFWGVKNV